MPCWSQHSSRIALLCLDAFVAEFNASSFPSDPYPHSLFLHFPAIPYILSCQVTHIKRLSLHSIHLILIFTIHSIFDYSMRFLAVFILVSCFVASEAFFGEDVFKGPGDFFSSVRSSISLISKSIIDLIQLMDKLKELTGGKEVVPIGGNSSLPDPGPIPEKGGDNGVSLHITLHL